MLCCSVMLSAYGAKAWTFTLQTRKSGITFFRAPSPRLSSPPCSSILGALLLLRDQETALKKPPPAHLKQSRVPWPCYTSRLGRDMRQTLLGEQELGDSRGTSYSTPEGPRVFSAENHHGQHYWPVRHYMEARKGLSSPVTCWSINQDESCGM